MDRDEIRAQISEGLTLIQHAVNKIRAREGLIVLRLEIEMVDGGARTQVRTHFQGEAPDPKVLALEKELGLVDQDKEE